MVRKVVAAAAGDPDAAEKSLHQAEDWVQKLKGNIIPDVDLDNVLECFYMIAAEKRLLIFKQLKI